MSYFSPPRHEQRKKFYVAEAEQFAESILDEQPTQPCYTGEDNPTDEVDFAELSGDAEAAVEYSRLADAQPWPQAPAGQAAAPPAPPEAPKKKPGRPKGANVLRPSRTPAPCLEPSGPRHGMRSKIFYVRGEEQDPAGTGRRTSRSR